MFRHYGILFKLLFTAVATGVLLLKLGPIDQFAKAAAEAGILVPGAAGKIPGGAPPQPWSCRWCASG